MTVRSIDMITMLPRTTEASRMQHQSEQQPAVAQHAQTLQSQQQADRARQQVAHKAPADRASIRKDGRGQGGGAGGAGGQGGRRKRDEGGEKPAQPGLGQRLDVKL